MWSEEIIWVISSSEAMKSLGIEMNRTKTKKLDCGIGRAAIDMVLNYFDN